MNLFCGFSLGGFFVVIVATNVPYAPGAVPLMWEKMVDEPGIFRRRAVLMQHFGTLHTLAHLPSAFYMRHEDAMTEKNKNPKQV